MNTDKEKDNLSPFKPNDHLANERTYLAWVRTGIVTWILFGLHFCGLVIVFIIDFTPFSDSILPQMLLGSGTLMTNVIFEYCNSHQYIQKGQIAIYQCWRNLLWE